MVLQLKLGHANCSGTSRSTAFSAKWIYFRIASIRQGSIFDAKPGDHCLQADFPVLMPAARVDYFRFSDNPPNHLRTLVTGFFAQNRAVIQLHKQHQS